MNDRGFTWGPEPPARKKKRETDKAHGTVPGVHVRAGTCALAGRRGRMRREAHQGRWNTITTGEALLHYSTHLNCEPLGVAMP